MKIKLKSGSTVEVYKSKLRATYINANDCTTEYKRDEVKVVSES